MKRYDDRGIPRYGDKKEMQRQRCRGIDIWRYGNVEMQIQGFRDVETWRYRKKNREIEMQRGVEK